MLWKRASLRRHCFSSAPVKSTFQEAVLPERVGEGAVAAVGTVQVALFKAGEAEIAVLDLGPSKDRVLKV